MAQFEQDFVVDQNAEEKSFDILPAGEYKAIICESDYAPTKNGMGKNLKLTYQVIDGPMNGRKIFENLCISYPSKPETQIIAQNTLSLIGKACGVNVLKDSAQLHNIPIMIKVNVTAAKGEYGPGNKIVKHEALSGNAPVQATPAAGFQAAPPASGVNKAPWQK